MLRKSHELPIRSHSVRVDMNPQSAGFNPLKLPNLNKTTTTRGGAGAK